MVRAVVFDIDGVLVHPFRFRDALAGEHGITAEMTAPFFRGPFLDCVEGRLDLADALPPFLASWGWPRSVSDFIDTWLATENAPNDAVLGVVAALRRGDVPCFVASTQERRRAHYITTEMRFVRLFDGLFFSSDLGVAKPDAEFFRTVTHRLGHRPADVLFFDDLSVNVEGARSVGWLAEQFTTVERLRADVTRHTGLVLDAGAIS